MRKCLHEDAECRVTLPKLVDASTATRSTVDQNVDVNITEQFREAFMRRQYTKANKCDSYKLMTHTLP